MSERITNSINQENKQEDSCYFVTVNLFNSNKVFYLQVIIYFSCLTYWSKQSIYQSRCGEYSLADVRAYGKYVHRTYSVPLSEIDIDYNESILLKLFAKIVLSKCQRCLSKETTYFRQSFKYHMD